MASENANPTMTHNWMSHISESLEQTGKEDQLEYDQ